jgi:glutamyl-tRNA reductase
MDHNSSTVRERTDFSSLGDCLPDLKSEGLVEEYLKLDTCNRLELYLVLPDSGDDRKAVGPLCVPGTKVICGYEAVRHLLRVLLGLESMARGESHIVSQVREAYKSSHGCGKVLHKLFQRALGMSASLRARCHPGREPSIPYIAASHFVKNFKKEGQPRVMVAGLGVIGTETARVLQLMGCDVRAANRSLREPDKKLAPISVEPWDSWKEAAKNCDAVFLCTSSDVPVLSSDEEDSMPDVSVFDLGVPHQSEPRGFGVRITLDEMKDIASAMTGEYSSLLAELEDEADNASSALLSEISILTDDTWKRLALTRANELIKDRAAACSGRIGAGAEDLEAFASSVIKAFLHPLASAHTAHSYRAWRILSGEPEDYGQK